MTSLYDNRRGATHANLAVAALLAIFFFSTAAKWATTHIAGALIALGLLAARRDFWLSPPARAYTAVSLMWLLPVIGATALQHAQDLVTATLWSKQATLILRILGIGLGILFILHKRWISLRQLTIIAMGCLLIHGLIGIGQWAQDIQIALERRGTKGRGLDNVLLGEHLLRHRPFRRARPH